MEKVMSEFKAGKLKSGGDKTVTKKKTGNCYRISNGTKGSQKKIKKKLKIMKILFSMILGSLLWIQVPQWDDDWEKCAVDVPDAACHWYVAAPDNTFGKGFSWKDAPLV